MKRMIYLLPFLFYGVQPYNQTTKHLKEDSSDSIHMEQFKIETDTMILNYTSQKLIEEVKELEGLEKRKRELQLQIRREKDKLRDKETIRQIEIDLHNFNNRGL